MGGTLSLAKAEISRLRRNKRYLIFTVALPVMFYLIFGKTNASGYGVSFKAFYMVGMASFGAFGGAFNNNALRISQERKDGWIRQLRLTPLPAYAYVAAAGGDEVIKVNVAADAIVGAYGADTGEGIAVTPSGSTLYIAQTGQYSVIATNLTTGAWATNLTLGVVSPDVGSTTTRSLTESAVTKRFFRVQAVVPLSP